MCSNFKRQYFKLTVLAVCLLIVYQLGAVTTKTTAAEKIFCQSDKLFWCESSLSCMASYVRCDGVVDCAEGEDESDCPTCDEKENWWKCPGPEEVCIPKSKRCNGFPDCRNAEDETSCEMIECLEDQFECKDRENSMIKCISQSWKCDGEPDCNDRSDELDCMSCPEFTCPNLQCIPERWVCDLDEDCLGGEDEANCDSKLHLQCTANEFVCKTDGQCAPLRWKCDGEIDCIDDEMECGLAETNNSEVVSDVACSDMEFECRDRSVITPCVILAWQCDGQNDCEDSSDEWGCETIRDVVCTPGLFKCEADNLCIPEELMCSGEPDCSDGADELEQLCKPGGESSICTSEDFQCHTSGRCISSYQTCDNHADCEDSSDERYCGSADPCIGQCHGDHQTCEVLYNIAGRSYDFNCSCNTTGRSYDINTKSCVDINECEGKMMPCGQTCHNSDGSFACSCQPGYQLMADHASCKLQGVEPKLLFIDGISIRQTNVHSSHASPPDSILSINGVVKAMDFDVRGNSIFYHDTVSKKIARHELPSKNQGVQTEPENLVINTTELDSVAGLSFDWTYNHLYWTNPINNTINMVAVDAPRQTTVLYNNQNPKCVHEVLETADVCIMDPKSITVHPSKGWIFWTDHSVTQPHIIQAALDGSHMEKMVYNTDQNTVIKSPSSLALDVAGGSKHLYWIDSKLNAIYTCHLEECMSTINLVLYAPEYITNPYSMAVFEDMIIWSDLEHKSIRYIHKISGSLLNTALHKLERPTDLKIFHGSSQPENVNVCDELIDEKPQCEHICVPKPWIRFIDHPKSQPPLGIPKHTCLCDYKYALQNDGRSCVPYEQPTRRIIGDVAAMSSGLIIGTTVSAGIFSVLIIILVIVSIARKRLQSEKEDLHDTVELSQARVYGIQLDARPKPIPEQCHPFIQSTTRSTPNLVSNPV